MMPMGPAPGAVRTVGDFLQNDICCVSNTCLMAIDRVESLLGTGMRKNRWASSADSSSETPVLLVMG